MEQYNKSIKVLKNLGFGICLFAISNALLAAQNVHNRAELAFISYWNQRIDESVALIDADKIIGVITADTNALEANLDALVKPFFDGLNKFRSSSEIKKDGLKSFIQRVKREAVLAREMSISEYKVKVTDSASCSAAGDPAACKAAKDEIKKDYMTKLEDILSVLKPELVNALIDSDSKVPGSSVSDDGKARYYFYAGSLNTLNKNSSFDSYSEFAFASETIRDQKEVIDDTTEGVVQESSSMDLTFTNIAQKESENDSDTLSSPFTKDSSIVRYQGTYEWLYGNGLGWIGGLGLTSQPDTETDSPNGNLSYSHLRGKYFAGVTYRNKFGENHSGRLFLVLAKDDFWKWDSVTDPDPLVDGDEIIKHNNFNERILLDGRLVFPGIFKGDSTNLMLRTVMDYSIDKEGPSDVRVSLLVSIDLEKFFK